MKYFYILTLLIGFIFAFIMQFVDFIIPSDVFVAETMAESPEKWTIQIEESLLLRLSSKDVKSDIVTALHNRAISMNEFYSRSLWQGITIMIFSIIGLFREGRIKKKRKSEQISPGESQG